MTTSTATSPVVPDEDGEDDYLTMTFAEPQSTTTGETLTQRKKRLAREAENRGRQKSKAEIAAEERSKRETALGSNKMDTTSKGFKMMAALGYRPGTALGADRVSKDGVEVDKRLLEPVGVEMKEGRSGIGADAEKKRKFREEVEKRDEGEKKLKVDEGDFRQRQQKEREEKKMDGQMWAAMKICEGLDEEDQLRDIVAGKIARMRPPLSSINVLWRGLERQRLITERDRRMRYDLHQSLSRRPDYDDPEEENEDRLALGKKQKLEEVDVDLDQDDPDLEEYEAMEVGERLGKLLNYLRERWYYCFWCKHRYPDETMEGCPGLLEDEHD